MNKECVVNHWVNLNEITYQSTSHNVGTAMELDFPTKNARLTNGIIVGNVNMHGHFTINRRISHCSVTVMLWTH